MMLLSRDRKAAMALLCVAASLGATDAFVNKPLVTRATSSFSSVTVQQQQLPPTSAFRPMINRRHTALQMASSDFDQMQYTEAAWSAVAAVTKVAEYYKMSYVEAPLLLDFLLNPGKHGGGEDAESANRVATKVLEQSGIDVKQLRSSLEEHLSRQPKLSSGGTQNIMGRDLPKVLESARTVQSVLGVSTFIAVLDFADESCF